MGSFRPNVWICGTSTPRCGRTPQSWSNIDYKCDPNSQSIITFEVKNSTTKELWFSKSHQSSTNPIYHISNIHWNSWILYPSVEVRRHGRSSCVLLLQNLKSFHCPRWLPQLWRDLKVWYWRLPQPLPQGEGKVKVKCEKEGEKIPLQKNPKYQAGDEKMCQDRLSSH